LIYNTAIITNGMNAAKVLGQPNFTDGTANTTQDRLSGPGFADYDPGSGRLFVTDSGNNRVMIFEGDTNSTKAQSIFIHGYE
jgi:DNA-binding beta-propeller fold protein YncE